MTLVSITVCARNAENWVEQCLSSLISQDYRPIEIIAVDDGSSDGTLEKMLNFRDSKLDHNIEISVIGSEPLGLSAGRQLALESANGEWVAITDIDCRPHPNWISAMMSAYDKDTSENVVAITGRTIFSEGNTRVSKIRSRTIQRKYEQRKRLVTLANGPCSMFRREALLSIGGFNPCWYHAEDMEVSLLLIQSGGSIIYESTALVQHVAEEGLLLFLRKRCRDARAHFRIVRKFGFQGVKNPSGSIMKHDFVSDAEKVVLLLPIFLIGVSMCSLGLVVTPNPYWWGITGITLIFVLFSLTKWTHILWSASLWYGGILGLCDAIFRRRGH